MAMEYVLFSRIINGENVSELVRKLNEISNRGQDIYLLLIATAATLLPGYIATTCCEHYQRG